MDEQEKALKKSTTKNRQLKICKYYYVCKIEYNLTFAYLQDIVAKHYLNLSVIDKFYNKIKESGITKKLPIFNLIYSGSDSRNNLRVDLSVPF